MKDIAREDAAMENYFLALSQVIDAALATGERYTASFDAEQTDFVRMNRGKVRQPGSVAQRYIAVRLIRGARHAKHVLSLTGDLKVDGDALRSAVTGLRAALPEFADDPHLMLPKDIRSSRSTRGGPLPPAERVIDEILEAARGTDLVGIYAAGPVWRGFANSEGQRNWHQSTTFNLQWSLYFRTDKAVKSGHAGFNWDGAALTHKMAEARERLSLISRPAKTLGPGTYRAYLAPSAMEEIASLLCWSGFSGRALATQQSALARMRSGETLDAQVSIAEDTANGVAPEFQSEGFARPASVNLVERGALVGSLVSPRTAQEFGLPENGANGDEFPESLVMAGGTLAEKDALEALGTGLAIGNLHYLNYSDRPACRMTGMTRFATFWVENGRIVAPIDVLRFDDTGYRLLGSQLEALTMETELLLDSGTYGARKLMSLNLPGALVSEMAFTL
ncbi:MAG: metallopeptidase TldD-related protein [Betaproteobacteria bacterium]